MSDVIKIIPGDLFFFLKKLPSSGDVYDTDEKNILDNELTNYHCGLFCDEFTIIHVLREKGTIQQPFWEAVSVTSPSRIEICRVKCSPEQRNQAVKFAYSELGTAYNDILTPNFINSKNQKAYSCTQLICEAFGGNMFEQEPMSLKDKNGNFYRHFVQLFGSLNMPIPEGRLGTWPTQFRKSKHLFLVKVFERENEKIVEKELDKENSKNGKSKIPPSRL
uniref:Uncharacterized protein n=1 Tax=Panagrolaimus sp. PS1159 TaxID=55785 RepID=A0AC35G062_9BILA